MPLNRMSTARLGLAVLLALASSPWLVSAVRAHPQDQPAAKQEDAAARKLRKARELMTALNQRKIAEKGVEIALENFALMGVPPEYVQKFKTRYDFDQQVESMAVIYAAHLEEADIDALLAFYQGAAGKKLAAAMPAITAEAAKMGSEYGQRLLQEIAAGK